MGSRHARQGRWSLLRRGRARRAFTLLEIIIVLSLLALLALLAWPNMSNRMQASELPESASRIRSTLYMARSGAIMEHRRVRVRFVEGEQQPFVEIERDPFLNPGIFDEVVAAWTEEPAMLGDVQVHSISLGRPEFLKPVAEEMDPDSDADEAATDSPEETEADVKTEETLALRTADEEELDPNRPTILFEPDGSSDWALLVVARQIPGEELFEDTEQRWIILDGRTGLISVREALTEEELADPDLCVQREKLELPKLDEDITDGIEALAGQNGMQDSVAGQDDQGLAAGEGFDAVQGGLGQGLGDMGQQIQDQGGLGSAQGRRGSGQKRNGNGLIDDPGASQDQGEPQVQQEFQASTLEELQQKLDESDLSEEEKKRILESFQEGEKGR